MAYLTVNDFVAPVTALLGNRTDLLTASSVDSSIPLYEWVAKAVIELTDNYQFEELRVTGPTLAFTANKAEYPRVFFTNGGEDWTDVDIWFMQLQTGTSTTIGWNLDYRAGAVVDPMSKIAGPPKFWTQHGDIIIVGLNPDKAYPTYWRYQRKHRFTKPVAQYDKIYMPDSWRDIIEYAAAQRGAVALRAKDYIKLYSNLLNGDEEYRTSGGKRGTPGLIFGRVSQQQRNKTHNSRQLAPNVATYGAR